MRKTILLKQILFWAEMKDEFEDGPADGTADDRATVLWVWWTVTATVWWTQLVDPVCYETALL